MDLINVDIYFMGAAGKEGSRFLSEAPTDSTRGNGHRLKHVKFFVDLRKSFIVRQVKHWNESAGEASISVLIPNCALG